MGLTMALLLTLLLSSASAQFVFFGGQHRPAQSVAPRRQPSLPFRQPSLQDTRQGRLVVQQPSPPAQPSPAQPAAPTSQPKGNHEFSGRRYLVTWRMGRSNFDWSGGQRFCSSQGMRLVSLDSKEKTDHFLGLLSKEGKPYFWTGGQVSRDSRTLTWQSGVTQPISKGQHPWSFTGRLGAQPDGGETCLAVLNNTYRDGVKFHDVACHHKKPVVCEEA